MPVHDWSRVYAGIYHHFHHEWISAIAKSLNDHVLPAGYYSLAEQIAADVGPDVLTLKADEPLERTELDDENGSTVATLVKPKLAPISELEWFPRKQKAASVRHVSDDRIVAMIEIVSPGNKSSRAALRSFVQKAASLVERKIHLMVIDVLPPTARDPQGIHGAIWEELNGPDFSLSPDRPLTAASYECALTTRAYVENFAVGDPLPEMPLFLKADGCVHLPLEATYDAAFAAVPSRWRTVLQGA